MFSKKGSQTHRFAALAAAVALALVILGCTGPTVGGTTSGTPGPTATPTPPPHALAWYQYDASNVPQIWASINDAAPAQITHVPSDHSDCLDQIAWSPPVFSPDLTHIVAALGSFNCGDGTMTGAVSIITVAGGAVSPVPNAGPNTSNAIRLTTRSAGWLDNHTIWYIGTGLQTYALGGANSTMVDSSVRGEDNVVRGTTLFYSHFTSGFGPGGTAVLSRYNVSTHAAIAGTINLGTLPGCECSPGDYHLPGFDASPDGSHVVYQVATPAGTSITSQFFYANADGSAASRIASYATANSTVNLQISPNGQLVAITGAEPAPDVLSASVSSAGHSGDPNLHFYTPSAGSYPGWKWDNSTFWAGNQDYNTGGSPGTIYSFTVGAPTGTSAVAGGYNPWYTIGS